MAEQLPISIADLASRFGADGIEVNRPDEEPCRKCQSPDTLSAWLPVEGEPAGTRLLFQLCGNGHQSLIN